jgi:N-acetylgalactosamine PTS system EIIB component
VIALVRVDNRLLHGQVLETWIPRLGIRTVVVADDEAARSSLAHAAMCLCVPPELETRIVPMAELDLAALAAEPAPALVLVRDVAGLTAAVAHGLTPARSPRLNLGNVHFGEGRRPVSPSVFLTAGEVGELADLAAAGFEVEARAIPQDAPVRLPELSRRYAAGT